MPTVYITGSSNQPSGGTKVMNQVAGLFEEHGLQSFVVPADDSGTATFLDDPANALTVNEYDRRLTQTDITIDFWPDKRLVDIAAQKRNKTRIFWQHGASIPIGGTAADDVVFRTGNPYTHHWNVSRACADYFKIRYGISMSIVHPFFDSRTMLEYQRRTMIQRKGFAILARRGQRFLPAVLALLQNEHVTVMKEPFHEREWFDVLCTHRFFVSIDDGIHAPSMRRRIKNVIRAAVSKHARETQRRTNRWIVPTGHLLGFPLPPTEAAWLGCVVIGFAMGGGLEWMNETNCLLAQDGDQDSLLQCVRHAQQLGDERLHAMSRQARQDVSRFTKMHTWEQVQHLLSL